MRYLMLLSVVLFTACAKSPTAPVQAEEPTVVTDTVALVDSVPRAFLSEYTRSRWGCDRTSVGMRREYTLHRGELPPIGASFCTVVARFGDPTATWLRVNDCSAEMWWQIEREWPEPPKHAYVWYQRTLREDGSCFPAGSVTNAEWLP